MKILQQHNHIGIWGFGVMGKSAARYFCAQGYRVHIMDRRMPTEQEQQFLRENNIRWYAQTSESQLFFNSSDFIISSPGVNISSQMHYATYKHKFITELDFFYQHFHKHIIAITGSVGKTSITHILGQLFAQLSIPVAVGGNIGTPTFDLLAQQNSVEYALLEVSSFQLHHCTSFAPRLAIWTNFYPNHLDHHATEDEYFLAKAMLLKHQKHGALSLLPLALRTKITLLTTPNAMKGRFLPAIQQTRAYFTTAPIHQIPLHDLHDNERVYYIENNCVMRYAHTVHTPLMMLTPELHNLSFIDNILILVSVCDLMGLDMHALHTIACTTSLPEHRMEYLGIINNVTFYNDSKATTTASTLAAVEKLKHKPLHLFLGGLSKGVDRAPFVAQLKNQVKYVYCFGKEALQLHEMCIKNNISSLYFTTLHEAFIACIHAINDNDCVLLSPAGSSFDLYDNYEKRGEHFKQLVAHYTQRHIP